MKKKNSKKVKKMKIRLDCEGLLFCTLKPNRGNSWLYIFSCLFIIQILTLTLVYCKASLTALFLWHILLTLPSQSCQKKRRKKKRKKRKKLGYVWQLITIFNKLFMLQEYCLLWLIMFSLLRWIGAGNAYSKKRVYTSLSLCLLLFFW